MVSGWSNVATLAVLRLVVTIVVLLPVAQPGGSLVKVTTAPGLSAWTAGASGVKLYCQRNWLGGTRSARAPAEPPSSKAIATTGAVRERYMGRSFLVLGRHAPASTRQGIPSLKIAEPDAWKKRAGNG